MWLFWPAGYVFGRPQASACMARLTCVCDIPGPLAWVACNEPCPVQDPPAADRCNRCGVWACLRCRRHGICLGPAERSDYICRTCQERLPIPWNGNCFCKNCDKNLQLVANVRAIANQHLHGTFDLGKKIFNFVFDEDLCLNR